MFNNKKLKEIEERLESLETYKHSKYHTEDVHGVIKSTKDSLEKINNELYITKYNTLSRHSYKVPVFKDLQEQIVDLQKAHNTALSELRQENKKLKALLNEVIEFVYKEE